MTHTIYRGRQRICPDPALHMQLSERWDRRVEIRRLQVEPIDRTIPFDEVLQQAGRSRRGGVRPHTVPDDAFLNNSPLPHQMLTVASMPAGLAERIPALPARTSEPDGGGAHNDHVFELKPTVRVQPAREPTT